ncbi:hypothetical protein DFH09DRAFT_1069516 [Mycena vulgaris]|nr:hypothetical protein DFH09DRAFT_1069516 [Mycena vulgaris]
MSSCKGAGERGASIGSRRRKDYCILVVVQRRSGGNAREQAARGRGARAQLRSPAENERIGKTGAQGCATAARERCRAKPGKRVERIRIRVWFARAGKMRADSERGNRRGADRGDWKWVEEEDPRGITKRNTYSDGLRSVFEWALDRDAVTCACMLGAEEGRRWTWPAASEERGRSTAGLENERRTQLMEAAMCLIGASWRRGMTGSEREEDVEVQDASCAEAWRRLTTTKSWLAPPVPDARPWRSRWRSEENATGVPVPPEVAAAAWSRSREQGRVSRRQECGTGRENDDLRKRFGMHRHNSHPCQRSNHRTLLPILPGNQICFEPLPPQYAPRVQTMNDLPQSQRGGVITACFDSLVFDPPPPP